MHWARMVAVVVPSPAMSEVFEGHFAHHLRAHVLERILQLHFLGHRHAVLGDGRAAELFLEDDVAALGTQRHLDRVGQLIHTAQDRLAGIFAIYNLFCCHSFFS